MDDGSKDDTGKIADAYAEKVPHHRPASFIRRTAATARGVNQGIPQCHRRLLQGRRLRRLARHRCPAAGLAELRAHLNDEQPLDLMMANYVYEHVADNTQNVVDYKGILPEGRVFTWKRSASFRRAKTS